MKLKLDSVAAVLDSNDIEALSDFYARLLGWTRVPYKPGDEWIVVVDGDYFALVFQQVDDYVRPTWPEAPGRQQQMMHLDFYVEDHEAAIEHALACGATLCEAQPGGACWRVLIDPAGHPFCILPKREK